MRMAFLTLSGVPIPAPRRRGQKGRRNQRGAPEVVGPPGGESTPFLTSDEESAHNSEDFETRCA